MAATSLADYQVLHDGSFTLGDNHTTEDLTFLVPSDMIIGPNSRNSPILAFKVFTVAEGQSIFRVFVNFREVHEFKFQHIDRVRTWWESWSTDTAWPEINGIRNIEEETTVRFVLHSGAVQISDVVVWYQVERGS